MKLLTERAVLPCAHQGLVQNRPSQVLVRIGGQRVLVETDPEGRTIKGCPNIGIGIKPCTLTLRVQQGYSSLLRVDGKRVCLDTVTGLTDGSPPGTVHYSVRSPGQGFVSEGGS